MVVRTPRGGGVGGPPPGSARGQRVACAATPRSWTSGPSASLLFPSKQLTAAWALEDPRGVGGRGEAAWSVCGRREIEIIESDVAAGRAERRSLFSAAHGQVVCDFIHHPTHAYAYTEA